MISGYNITQTTLNQCDKKGVKLEQESSMFCFIDTNILIHFSMLDEIDWPTILGVKKVCLVIPVEVLNELDKHKNIVNNDRLQKRARLILSWLKTKLKQGKPEEQIQIRKNVTLLGLRKEPRVNWQELRLDNQVNDDRILASIIEFKNQHPLYSIGFMSDDFTPRYKAEGLDILVFDPLDNLTKIESASDESVQLKKLQKQLETRIPQISLHFLLNGNPVEKITIPCPTPKHNFAFESDVEIGKILENRKQYLDNVLFRAVNEAMNRRAEITRYTEDYQEYMRQLEIVLKTRRSKQWGCCCNLAFVLKNTGSLPAENIEVKLTFPDNSYILDTTYDKTNKLNSLEYEDFTEPEPYFLRYSGFDIEERSISIPRLYNTTDRLIGNLPNSPSYNILKEPTVTYLTPKLPHKKDLELYLITVYIPPEIKGALTIPFIIHADNLPNPIDGKLQVILQKPSL